MKKGLVALFAAALAISASVSFGYAPTIRPLPDITIGDMEDNLSTQDRNFFVFTNAFRFDDYAQDQDTTVSSLLWSFDEWDDPVTPNARWFTVNGVQALHLGSAEIASADGTTSSGPHLNPGASEIRQGNELAYFRDIVLSPPPGTGPFSPGSADLAEHATGKSVYFYVSDQTSVASAECFVKSVDNVYDNASAPGVLWYKDDTFDTANVGAPGGTIGWAPFGMSVGNVQGMASAYVSGSYNAIVPVDNSGTLYRVGGWEALRSENMPFNAVGTDNYVRAKFYVYATGQSNPSALNTIPNLRMRVNERYAYANLLEVQAHQNAGSPGTVARDVEMAPSRNAAAPSVYRVDLAPIAIPDLLTNGDNQRISRAFEAYSFDGADNGSVCMTESSIGTYAKSLVPVSQTPDKTYSAAELVADPGIPLTSQLFNWSRNTAAGVKPAILGAQVTQSNSGSGILINTSAVATDQVGAAAIEFNAGSVQTARVRVVAGKQYVIRYHITSTTNANANPQVRPRARTIGFAWTSKLEVGGAYGTGGETTNNVIAKQSLPGVGSMNPDQRTPGENGGWYTLIMHTPISAEINPSQTQLNALPKPGDNVSGAASDLKIGLDVLDTLSQGPNFFLETGSFLCDTIEVRTYDLVPE